MLYFSFLCPDWVLHHIQCYGLISQGDEAGFKKGKSWAWQSGDRYPTNGESSDSRIPSAMDSSS